MKPQGLTSVPGSCAFRLMQLQLAIFILLTICGTDNKEGSPGTVGGFFLSVMHSKTWSREIWNWSYVGQLVNGKATRGH